MVSRPAVTMVGVAGSPSAVAEVTVTLALLPTVVMPV